MACIRIFQMFTCFSEDQLQNVNDIRGSSDNKSGIEIVQGSMVQTQVAFYVNLHRAVIGPSATLTGRWRPDIDLRRMLTGKPPPEAK